MVVCGEFWWVSLSSRMVELKLTWVNSILCATIIILTCGRSIGNKLLNGHCNFSRFGRCCSFGVLYRILEG
jgi:hypothetical protein